ncbi:hypothetical protein [Streptomyces albipurpureus]|uniref:Uncharacterized protein n=1 Tax=Streptomyces albipurpureus TaxID=2897419 RepID=A0ABT0UTQ3_9ACTN|nr:hypothetical protein [Streptomyces sp. CWNU-1]MCM2391829.1 hypothetical protein [Streptomyces sp. CWNU-1]
MCDRIARALVWVLNVLPWTRRPRPGWHSADYSGSGEMSGRVRRCSCGYRRCVDRDLVDTGGGGVGGAEHCCDCGKLTRAPIAVRHLHTTNGPGTTLYTCPHCFPNHDPGPTPGDLIWKA